VKEEEGELFPKMRREFTKGELDELGQALADAKKVAPTKPHPRAPDEPPGNMMAAAAQAPFEIARQAVRAVAGKR